MSAAIVLWIGQAVCILGGLMIVAGLLIVLALLSVWAQVRMVEACGGWKVFYQFRDWYHQQGKEPKP